MASYGSVQVSTKFGDCFCYTAATGFCHGGSNFINSDACQNWMVEDYNWVFAVLVLIFATLLFPCFFVCARFCCQCCGGRHPTRGCCCSDVSSASYFPGYSKCSIITTRLMFVMMFAFTIVAGVVTMHHNGNLHDDVNNQLIAPVKTVTQGIFTYGQALNPVTNYQTNAGYYAVQLTNANPTVDTGAIQTMLNVIDDIHDAENSNWYGRNHFVFVMSAWSMVVPCIALLPMLFSCKSIFNFFVVVHALVAFCVLVVAAPSGVISQGVGQVCDNWWTVSAPLIQQGMASMGVSATYTTTVNLQQNFQTIFASVPTSGTNGMGSSTSGSTTGGANFCSDVATVCASIGGCSSTPCTTSTFPVPTYGCNGATPMQFYMNSYGTTFKDQLQTMLTSSCSANGQTIQTLANTYGATNSEAARHIVDFANAIGAMGSINANDWVNQLLFNDNLCGNVRQRAQSVAIGLGMQYMVAFFTIIVLFLGIKRFTKISAESTNQTTIPEYQALNADASVVTAVVVIATTDAPWSPAPTGYATTPIAGYGTLGESEYQAPKTAESV